MTMTYETPKGNPSPFRAGEEVSNTRRKHCTNISSNGGLSPSLKPFEELMKTWSKFIAMRKRLTKALMNSRGALSSGIKKVTTKDT